MCAVLCGLDELGDIVIFARERSKFFKKRFGINVIPSKPTFSRILNMVDGEEVAKIIIEIMKERVDCLGDIIAVDGKAIRCTLGKKRQHSMLQILTAYLTESRVILGQECLEQDKTNEIVAFKDLLNAIAVKGKTITADALHCQKYSCEKIIEKEGNYVLGLKENQKTLYDKAKSFIMDDNNLKYIEEFETNEKNAGRQEHRICKKVIDISSMGDVKDWVGLKSIFSVRRIISSKEKTTDETSYYITSLDVSAKKLLHISRDHWKIESMHWLLDVVFSEDDCRIISENGHKTLNIFRKLALMLHKKYISTQPKKCSIKSNLLNCLLSEQHLYEIIESL
jgi:predicted transposase YbfD/YdcC